MFVAMRCISFRATDTNIRHDGLFLPSMRKLTTALRRTGTLDEPTVLVQPLEHVSSMLYTVVLLGSQIRVSLPLTTDNFGEIECPRKSRSWERLPLCVDLTLVELA